MTTKKVVTARHAQNFYWGKDPHLHPLGIWQALKLGYYLRFVAKIRHPTILCSNARRCRATAWIVLLWFPEIWFLGHLRYYKLLNISQNAGDRVSELRIRKIMRLLWKQQGNAILITHHQLANTKPLTRFASERSAHLTAVEHGTGKVSPGGACLLDLEAEKLSLLCGRWVLKR